MATLSVHHAPLYVALRWKFVFLVPANASLALNAAAGAPGAGLPWPGSDGESPKSRVEQGVVHFKIKRANLKTKLSSSAIVKQRVIRARLLLFYKRITVGAGNDSQAPHPYKQLVNSN